MQTELPVWSNKFKSWLKFIKYMCIINWNFNTVNRYSLFKILKRNCEKPVLRSRSRIIWSGSDNGIYHGY
jgi:hypothetical protein